MSNDEHIKIRKSNILAFALGVFLTLAGVSILCAVDTSDKTKPFAQEESKREMPVGTIVRVTDWDSNLNGCTGVVVGAEEYHYLREIAMFSKTCQTDNGDRVRATVSVDHLMVLK